MTVLQNDVISNLFQDLIISDLDPDPPAGGQDGLRNKVQEAAWATSCTTSMPRLMASSLTGMR